MFYLKHYVPKKIEKKEPVSCGTQYAYANAMEPSPWCTEEMSLKELIDRREFLICTYNKYYKHAEYLDNQVQSVDPFKFRGLKDYYLKRIEDTNNHIRKHEAVVYTYEKIKTQ